MSKVRITPDLAATAREIFRAWGWSLPTGANGLSRSKLRALQRLGVVTGKLHKLPSGSIVNLWTWTGPK